MERVYHWNYTWLMTLLTSPKTQRNRGWIKYYPLINMHVQSIFFKKMSTLLLIGALRGNNYFLCSYIMLDTWAHHQIKHVNTYECTPPSKKKSNPRYKHEQICVQIRSKDLSFLEQSSSSFKSGSREAID